MSKRILITGSEGVLASYLIPLLKNYDLFLGTKKNLDITNKKLVDKVFKKFKPEVVFHLAAETDVDKSESNPAHAKKINEMGTKNIVSAAKKYKSILIYMSTAAVFNGEKNFYVETDEASPINVYGRTKLAGERIVTDGLNKYFIVRCGWLIGGGKKEKKFLSLILQQVRSGQTEIKAISDIMGSIAYAKDLSLFLKSLLRSKNYGIYHFGNKGKASRYVLAKYFLKKMGYRVNVVPVSHKVFAKSFIASRPRNEVVKSKKIQYNSHWKEAINNYIEKELRQEKSV